MQATPPHKPFFCFGFYGGPMGQRRHQTAVILAPPIADEGERRTYVTQTYTFLTDAGRLSWGLLHVFPQVFVGRYRLFGLHFKKKKWPLTLMCHYFLS